MLNELLHTQVGVLSLLGLSATILAGIVILALTVTKVLKAPQEPPQNPT